MPKYKSVYFSARHEREDDLRENAAAKLQAAGVEIASRWYTHDRYRGRELDTYYIERTSWEDLERADVFVLLADDGFDSGRRHVEMGMALALNKPMIVLASKPENGWQRLPTVKVVKDWDSVVKLLVEDGSLPNVHHLDTSTAVVEPRNSS